MFSALAVNWAMSSSKENVWILDRFLVEKDNSKKMEYVKMCQNCVLLSIPLMEAVSPAKKVTNSSQMGFVLKKYYQQIAYW